MRRNFEELPAPLPGGELTVTGPKVPRPPKKKRPPLAPGGFCGGPGLTGFQQKRRTACHLPDAAAA